MAKNPYVVGTSYGPSAETGSTQTTTSGSQNVSANLSNTYIPDYLESPILRQIAQYSAGMAPQIYQWGMDQFNKNQGNIDTMMRNALSYASPQRIASQMGQAQAGVMQGAEAGRQSAIQDLQSFGIDPSSGRYAALDQASRVMGGAAAAGAGNQARVATEAQGSAMQNQAMGLSLQNVNTGYGAANAANQFLSTGMQLKFPPLGQASVGGSQGTSGSTSTSDNWSQQVNYGTNRQEGGDIGYDESPSAGARVDDVPANLTAGEFVIPKDVAEWKGQEFFYKLMAQARKMRATAGSEGGMDSDQNGSQPTGYAQDYRPGVS